MSIIMIAYYLLCVFLLGLLAWNFLLEKKSRDDIILYILVMIPLLLRILRVK